MKDAKKIIFERGDGIRAIIGNINNDESLILSPEQVEFCIQLHKDLQKIYQALDPAQKTIVDKKLKILIDEHGALDTECNKSNAIYAYDMLLAFNDLVNQQHGKIK